MSYFLFLVFSGRHHACMIRDSKYLYGLKKCRVMIHFPIRMHMVGDARITEKPTQIYTRTSSCVGDGIN